MPRLLICLTVLLLLDLGLSGAASAETNGICRTQDGLELQFHSRSAQQLRIVTTQSDGGNCEAKLKSGRFCSNCRGTPFLDADLQLMNCSGSLVAPSTGIGRDQIRLHAGIPPQLLSIDGNIAHEARNAEVAGFHISRRIGGSMGVCLVDKPVTLRDAIKMMTGHAPANNVDQVSWWKSYLF